MLISIISPVYKGERMVEELVARIEAATEKITTDYEIVLVNDCSPDNSWTKIEEICSRDKHVKGVNLSRNFGQHYAITAGLTESCGDWVVVMDCDLQDRPEEIPNLYNKAQEGYDTVFAEIMERSDQLMKKKTSNWFGAVFAFFTDSPKGRKTNNFGIYHRKVINAVLSMGDIIKCFPIAVYWVGFRIGFHPVIKDARAEGTSGYTWAKLIAFALDNIIGFSNKPLRLMLRLGFGIVTVSLLLSLYYFIRYIAGGIAVSGFTTIVISLWLIGGIIISLIGIVGIYIGRVFEQVKNRPVYIIKDKINF